MNIKDKKRLLDKMYYARTVTQKSLDRPSPAFDDSNEWMADRRGYSVNRENDTILIELLNEWISDLIR